MTNNLSIVNIAIVIPGSSLRTGRSFAVTTQREWQILISIAALLGLALLIFYVVGGTMSLSVTLIGGFVLGYVLLIALRSH